MAYPKIISNNHWGGNIPVISVITAIYNRGDLFDRPLSSLAAQSYKDFEYIIVNDGSTEDVDSVVIPYMQRVDFPVLYITKDNGGPHTARNLGVKYARGKYVSILDADDGLFPNALETYANTWASIADDPCYHEVVARNVDENGNVMSLPYPSDINSLPRDKAYAVARNTGVHNSVIRTDILVSNPFPEPEGVKFVDETILWRKLERQYRAYYLNDVLFIYSRDTGDSITHSHFKKKNIQHCINCFYNSKQFVENALKFELPLSFYLRNILLYTLFKRVLKLSGEFPEYTWATTKIHGVANQVLYALLYLPCLIGAKLYIDTRM